MTTRTILQGRAMIFDPHDPAVIDDPYPVFASLRRATPVPYLEEHDVWLVTRYRDVVDVLRNPEHFSSRLGIGVELGAPPRSGTGINYRVGAPGVRMLIATDPPEHGVFRRAVNAGFSRAAVARLGDRVRSIAHELVHDLLARNDAGDADFFRDVAEPLPVLVLAEVLGVSPEQRGAFRSWSRLVTTELEQSAPKVDIGRGIDMFRHFRREVLRRRQEPREDVLGALARARDVGITDDEVLAFCAFLLVAGIETTTNLLTNLVAALSRFPEEQARLRARPELVGTAVEEALRYDSPIQGFWRASTQETAIDGQRLPAGARLLVMFGSANRDEAQFDDPEAFRVDRQPNEHVAFGVGPHYCLGARLARAEVTAVLTELLLATRDLRTVQPGRRMRSVVLRGFVEQPVVLEPR